MNITRPCFAKKSEVAALLKEARAQHEAGQGTGFWAVYTSQDKLVPGAFSFASRPVGEDPAVADETIERKKITDLILI